MLKVGGILCICAALSSMWSSSKLFASTQRSNNWSGLSHYAKRREYDYCGELGMNWCDLAATSRILQRQREDTRRRVSITPMRSAICSTRFVYSLYMKPDAAMNARTDSQSANSRRNKTNLTQIQSQVSTRSPCEEQKIKFNAEANWL